MKSLKLFAHLALVTALSCMIISCGNNAAESQEAAPTEETSAEIIDDRGKEYTSDYVCPMHCEGSGSDKPGTCPVCGMDYVQNHTHACPMHPEITGIRGGECPVCGMELKPVDEMEDHDHDDHDHDDHEHGDHEH